MAAFDLTTNPFWLLRTSIRARPEDVIDALEIAVSDEVAPESELIHAQQIILAPRTRLEAELGWFPELSPARARNIVGVLAANPPREIAVPLLDGLEGISRVNLAADICRRYPGHVDLVDNLAKSYQALSLRDLEESINASRAIAGFGRVDSNALKAALTKAENEHAEATTVCLAASPSPGRALSQLMTGTAEPGSLHFEFFDATIRSYRTWAGTRLQQIDDAIQKEIADMKGNPANPGTLQRVCVGMGLWSEWNGPVEQWDQAKGLEEPRSHAICNRLRDLSLWLANDMDQHKAALEITEGLRSYFAKLPSMSEQLDEDINTLRGLVESEAISSSTRALQRVIDSMGDGLPSLGSYLLARGFGHDARGIARELYESFQSTVSTTRGTEHGDVPWRMIRGVMIDLNNQGHRDASERLGRDLLAAAQGKVSANFLAVLEDDLRTIRNNIIWSQIEYAIKVGRRKQALPLLQALIADQSPKEDLDHLVKLYLKVQADILEAHRRNKKRVLKWVIGIIVLTVWIWIKSRSSATPDTFNQQVVPTPAPTVGSGANTPSHEPSPRTRNLPVPDSESKIETKPPVGTQQILTLGQLRYCQFQHARIARAKILSTTNDEIENVNNAVDDFNMRCSQYRYHESDMTEVQSELQSKHLEIDQDAQALMMGSTNP